VPFYACVPTPTIDWEVNDALAGIPIEERSEEEVRVVRGIDRSGKYAEVSVVPAATPVANPAFDVTPASLVTGIITEKGVVRADENALLALWPRSRENKAYLT
jgi:methylthioribose-1-phosphate isomerase